MYAVQVAPAARVVNPTVPQVPPLRVKSDAVSPTAVSETAKVGALMVELPLLVNVKFTPLLVDAAPCKTEPKSSDEGDALTVRVSPKPVSETVTLLLALLGMVNVPTRLPAPPGVDTMRTLQVCPGARVWPAKVHEFVVPVVTL